jgi:AmmeMemoRadiSam system protein B
MNIYRRLGILGTAALMAAVFGSGCTTLDVKSTPSKSITETRTPRPEPPVNADAFLDVARFHASASGTSTRLSGRPIAGVVNHHVLASDLLTRFFRSIRAAHPNLRRIIILAPDHFQRGTDAISINTFTYASEGRVLSLDATSTQSVLVFGSPASRALIEGEHGIGALIPFLSREYADMEIVSVAIRADVPRERIRTFGASLAPLLNDQTMIVVSSDMSHYLSEREALKNDVKTEGWLRDLNRPAMETATDDFTDNGPSFVALFSLFEALNIQPGFQKIDHTISSQYGGDPSYTTSYITGVWSVK